MITKTQIDVSDVLNDFPFKIVDKRNLLCISKEDVVDIIDQLTSTFLKRFHARGAPNSANRCGRYVLGEFTIYKEPGRSQIIDGHELVVTLALLIMYLYRNINDSDCREVLKFNCGFGFNRLYPQAEDNWDSRLAAAAIMDGYTPKPEQLSDISSHLLLLFEDIENSMPKPFQGDVLAAFGTWLPHNVLMDCVESRCEHGKRLLVNAYAHEQKAGTASH